MTGNRPKTKITENADQLKCQRTGDMMGEKENTKREDDLRMTGFKPKKGS